jgi:hypothetical protein
MSYQRHECRSERGERRTGRVLQHALAHRPFFLSRLSVGWPLVCSIGLLGFGASSIASADERSDRPVLSATTVAARPSQRGTPPAPQAVSRSYVDTRLSAKLLKPAPSPPDADQPAAADDLAKSSPVEEENANAGSDDGPAAAPLGSELIALQSKIRRVLTLYAPKHQNTRDNNAWEVMHEIIAFGVDAQLYRGGPQGSKVNAIGWLCYNGSCKGEQMLYLDHNKLVARKGPGVQGHFGQFLAILAQSRLPIDYPMLVHGKSFTIGDLVEHEKSDCQPGEELTFKLIGLMHYLDSDETWTSRYGEKWSIPRLISEELKQPIRGAACGGTHRLMGFSYAINKRTLRGKPMTGEFLRAQKFINNYHRYTFSLQNPDGSFSTQWFTRREANTDIDRRLKTTGHVAEWLSFSMSDDELRDPHMTKAIDYLATILLADPSRTWEIGPLGHGLHALAVYDARLSAARQSAEASVVRLPTVVPTTGPSYSILPAAPRALAPRSSYPATQSTQGDVDQPGLELPASEIGDDVDARSNGGLQRACPAAKPIFEVVEKLPWGMPPCEIGNDSDDPPLVAPDTATAPGHADDEMCL